MLICFVAPANNYHTKKWANWFLKRGHVVHVISFTKATIPGVMVHYIDSGANVDDSNVKKLRYLLQVKKIRKILWEIKPDIVNAHYASSYGAAMALSGYHPYILSVWGSDIYDFPRLSPFHKALLQYALKKADVLFSTSNAMAEEGKKYTNKKFHITPFGVDMNLFNPDKRNRHQDGKFVIGTVKSLTPKYGIDTLLKGAALFHRRNPKCDLEVRIAGKGNSEKILKKLADDLGISSIVSWLGFISQEKAAEEWANMDVGVVTSESESFGVSAVECQACGRPLIISNIGGLKEATIPNKTCAVIPRYDYKNLAEKLIYFYLNSEEREQMGERGRRFVENEYELNKCFERIEELYNGLMEKETFCMKIGGT